jgi:hypothetical protein
MEELNKCKFIMLSYFLLIIKYNYYRQKKSRPKYNRSAGIVNLLGEYGIQWGREVYTKNGIT